MTESTWSSQLDIAGLRVDVTVAGAHEDRLLYRFANYIPSSRGESVARVELEVGERYNSLPQPDDIAYPGCLGRIQSYGSIEYRRTGLHATWNPHTRVLRGVSTPSNLRLAREQDPTPLDTPLRLLTSFLLPSNGGVLLHSSGYGDDRGGIVFTGVSTAGKTTTARKLPTENVLSDDQVAVRRVGSEWFAFSTPFVGEYARATVHRVTPLRRVCLLRKGSAGVQVRSIHPALAVTRLLSCVPWFVPHAPEGRQLLALTTALATSVPVCELEIGRDEPIMPTIHAWLDRSTT